MNKLLLNDHSVFLFENGKLKNLGTATDMRNIRGHIFQVGAEIYALRGEEFGFIAQGFGYKVIGCSKSCDLMVKKLSEYRPTAETQDLIWTKYLEIKAQDTVENFNRMVTSGIAVCNSSGLRLFLSDSGFVPEDKVINLSFGNFKCFLYQGAVYAADRDMWLTKLDLNPIYQGKNYLIFNGGRNFVFALTLKGEEIKVVKLGLLYKVIETKVGRLLLLEQEGFDEYALYHLGENLEFIQKFDGCYNFKVDNKSGRVVITVGRAENAHQEMYVFKKGVYERLSV